MSGCEKFRAQRDELVEVFLLAYPRLCHRVRSPGGGRLARPRRELRASARGPAARARQLGRPGLHRGGPGPPAVPDLGLRPLRGRGQDLVRQGRQLRLLQRRPERRHPDLRRRRGDLGAYRPPRAGVPARRRVQRPARVQPVYVNEPSVEDTISILRGIKEKYELHHGVRITDGAIVAAATLSNRYITDRYLPDKAIDLVDEAASRLRMEVDSKPEAIDELDRRIVQLKIEREARQKRE